MRLTGVDLFLIWCCFYVNFIGAQRDPYYELWSSKFESVNKEMEVLRDLLFESERQLGETRAEISALALALASKEGVDRDPEKPVTVTSEPILKESALSALLRGFNEEKRYIRNLGKQLQGSLAEYQARQTSRIGKLERKNDFRLERLENNAQLTSSRQGEMDSKLQHALGEVGRQSEQQSSLSHDVQDIYKILQVLSNRRCLSGSFGDHEYPEESFPKTYRVDFNPPFRQKPNFMHALKLLDSDAIVRVSVELQELTRKHATVKINTWANTKMWGARVQWMACP